MRRRRVILGIQVAVSVVLLVLQLRHVDDFQDLLPEWRASNLAWLAAGLAFTLAGIVLSAVRWQQVIHALNLRARVRSLLPHYLAGQFVSYAFIGTTSGDVLRVWRLSNDTGNRPASFASVVVERLTGWLVLPLLTLFAFLINPGLRELGRATAVATGVAVVTLVLLGAILTLAASRRLMGRLTEHENWLRFLGAVHLGLDRFRRHPAAILSVLVAAIAYQVVVMTSVFIAGHVLDIRVSYTAVLAFMPAVSIIQVLPITVGGFGAREWALRTFLTPLGVTAEQAIALGVLFWLMNLAVGLLGFPALAVGGRPAADTDPTADIPVDL